MPNITQLIKELREKTGAGFLDCKKSLEENNNDIAKSIEALRKKGLAIGVFLIIKRILKCNPFFSGGCDPVE